MDNRYNMRDGLRCLQQAAPANGTKSASATDYTSDEMVRQRSVMSLHERELPEHDRPDEDFLDFAVARYKQAMRIWADNHPLPNDPVVGIATGEFFTPGELAAAVEHGTEVGQRDIESFVRFAMVRGKTDAMRLIDLLENPGLAAFAEPTPVLVH
ncbi:MAG: hypothetical protein ACKVVP_15915 [Chloroflexota bacterium]